MVQRASMCNLKCSFVDLESSHVLQVWDAVSGEEVHSFQHNHIVKSVNFSSDSVRFATGSNEKLVRVYDLNKPEESESVDSVRKLVDSVCC